MKNNTMTFAMIFIIVGLIALTLIMLVLTGENGVINQEKESYNETHQEEFFEDNNTVVVNK